MKDIKDPNYDDWEHAFFCTKCETGAVAERDDLRKAMFKTSGYHFAGTAVSEMLYFVYCPNQICGKEIFIKSDLIPSGLQLQVVEE